MRTRWIIGGLALVVTGWIAAAIVMDLMEARRRATLMHRMVAIEQLEKARLIALHECGVDQSLQMIVDANYVNPPTLDAFLREPGAPSTTWQARAGDMPLLCDRAGRPLPAHRVDQPTRYGALVFLPHERAKEPPTPEWSMIVMPTHGDPNYLVVFNDAHAESLPAVGFVAALRERNEIRASRGAAPIPDVHALTDLLGAP